LYDQGKLNDHGQAIRARDRGVSLRDIERFDTTGLHGADEHTINFLHAVNAPLGTPLPALPPREAGGTPPYAFDGEDGDELGGAATKENPAPAPRERTPPAPLGRVVVSPVAGGVAPVAPIPIATLRRQTVVRPSDPPGIPTNAVYAVGTIPVPKVIQDVVDEITTRAAIKSNKAGLPQRVDLRNMSSGVKDLDRRYGYIVRDSRLMAFYGDLRLFNEATWKYLVTAGKGPDA
jgi:hypothetical protein